MILSATHALKPMTISMLVIRKLTYPPSHQLGKLYSFWKDLDKITCGEPLANLRSFSNENVKYRILDNSEIINIVEGW